MYVKSIAEDRNLQKHKLVFFGMKIGLTLQIFIKAI